MGGLFVISDHKVNIFPLKVFLSRQLFVHKWLRSAPMRSKNMPKWNNFFPPFDRLRAAFADFF